MTTDQLPAEVIARDNALTFTGFLARVELFFSALPRRVLRHFSSRDDLVVGPADRDGHSIGDVRPADPCAPSSPTDSQG